MKDRNKEAPEVPASLIDEHEAAKLLSVSVAYLRKNRSRPPRERALLVPYYRIGRLVRYRRSELIRWLEERRHAG